MAAFELSKGRDVQYAAGLALGLPGDSSRSEALAGDLENRFPEDTFVKFTYAPVLRGLALLGHRKSADSVERLQIALTYELAVNGLNFNLFYLGGLHSAYVRGEALIAAHRYAEAAPSFKRFSVIAVSWARIPSAHWRTCNSGERTLHRGTTPKRRVRTRVSSHFGRTPTPRCGFSQAKKEYAKLQ